MKAFVLHKQVAGLGDQPLDLYYDFNSSCQWRIYPTIVFDRSIAEKALSQQGVGRIIVIDYTIEDADASQTQAKAD